MTPAELREAVHGIIHDFTGEGSEEAADAAIAIVLDAAAEVAEEEYRQHVDLAIYGEPSNARNRESAANTAERISISIRALKQKD